MVEVWPGAMEAGLKEHVTSLEQLSVTDLVKDETVAATPTVRFTEVALTSVVPDGPVELRLKSAVEFPFTVSVGAVPEKFEVTLIEPMLSAVDEEVEDDDDDTPVVVVGLNVT